ncbi:hypothetical protein J3A78_006561 [Streptomyces sp. PvR006]|uniref:hypothetical protein n=1 Tax=Streptomyces sp. PvR006 TaxID=2817860 RepID=UPI001AEB15DD|nr:hypothetical protein [Streptomyces sp. PvR006]MBP2586083.1 hypothetical protein [Streptomyces sp. PvR006]
MSAVLMPDEFQVPPGPHRTLLGELLALHRQAGDPSLSLIARRIRAIDDRTTEVSHQTVSAMLTKGRFSTWAKVEAIVLALASIATGRPAPREVALWFHCLWQETTESGPPPGGRHGPTARRRPDRLLPAETSSGTPPTVPEEHWAAEGMTAVRLEFTTDPRALLVDVGATAEETTVVVNSAHPLAAAFFPRAAPRPSGASQTELRREIRQMRRSFDILMIAWGMTAGDAP